MKIFKLIVLILSGLALFYACSMRLINPSAAVFLQTFFENPANTLSTHIDLVSEIRGVGAVMLLGGIVAFIAAVREDFKLSAFMVLTVIFGGVILGRSISIFLDGMPPTDLIRAAFAEGVLAILNIVCLVNGVAKVSKLSPRQKA